MPISPSPRADIGLRVLGSGSSGNAALVFSGRTLLLVEAGLSGRELGRRIRNAGRSPAEVAAVLVSHEHGDHCRGAVPFATRHGVPIACTRGTWDAIGGAPGPCWIPLVPGQPREFESLTVHAFPTPHDAAEPVGFRFETGGRAGGGAVVHVTDFGHLSSDVADAIEGATVLLIESNHDEERLFHSRYPPSTRRRIASPEGHLSNGALALYLRRHLPDSVDTVVLAHLSENTNTPELAWRTARSALDAGGRRGVRLLVAERNTLTEEVRTGRAAPALERPRRQGIGVRSTEEVRTGRVAPAPPPGQPGLFGPR